MSEPLSSDVSDAVSAARPRLGEFAELRHVVETDSTNDVALALAGAGAPEGTSVLADLQRAGRGRRGRQWFSPPGAGLYLSIIVRPTWREGLLSLVTIAAGVAAAEAVRAVSGLPVELKWPNDLVAGRPWRKLGGVLSESAGVGARIDAIVIGLGINLRSAAYPAEIADRATSIEAELGRPIDRTPLVVECLAQVRRAIADLRAGRREALLDAWRQFGRAGLQGAAVRWQEAGRDRRGLARDVDGGGALIVESEGRTERLIAGEVHWERLGHD